MFSSHLSVFSRNTEVIISESDRKDITLLIFSLCSYNNRFKSLSDFYNFIIEEFDEECYQDSEIRTINENARYERIHLFLLYLSDLEVKNMKKIRETRDVIKYVEIGSQSLFRLIRYEQNRKGEEELKFMTFRFPFNFRETSFETQRLKRLLEKCIDNIPEKKVDWNFRAKWFMIWILIFLCLFYLWNAK